MKLIFLIFSCAVVLVLQQTCAEVMEETVEDLHPIDGVLPLECKKNDDCKSWRAQFQKIAHEIHEKRKGKRSGDNTQTKDKPKDGKVTTLQPLMKRIINGSEATQDQFPFFVSVVVNKSSICGGSLLNNVTVLTAGHCCPDANVSLTMVFGAWNLSNKMEYGRKTVTSYKKVRHPGYVNATLENDLCIIKLPSPITYTTYIKPVSLTTTAGVEDSLVNASTIAMGRGRSSDTGTTNPVLSWAELFVTTNTLCSKFYGKLVFDTTLCAHGINTTSTCRGDSGGPLVTYNNNIYQQVGITSFGSPDGCMKGDLVGFARISSFLPWILENMQPAA